VDRDGLRLTAADARAYRLDPASFAARLAADSGASAVTTSAGAPLPAVSPAYYTPNSTQFFQQRGLVWPGRWLGVLSDSEATRLVRETAPGGADERRRPAAAMIGVGEPPSTGQGAPVRYRLWSARISQVSAAPPGWPADFPDNWGTRKRYADVAPLPESPEFLQAGLLGPGSVSQPVVLRDPDGVLVLHRDRLGEEGKLRLTRIAGPGGRPVWLAALPLSVLQSVMPGERSVVLLGIEYAEPPPGASSAEPRGARDPFHDAHERLVSVDLATGTVGVYDLDVDGLAQPATRWTPRER
jgi:hypothetical protein